MANITAAEHPKLVIEMTAMERTTPNIIVTFV